MASVAPQSLTTTPDMAKVVGERAQVRIAETAAFVVGQAWVPV